MSRRRAGEVEQQADANTAGNMADRGARNSTYPLELLLNDVRRFNLTWRIREAREGSVVAVLHPIRPPGMSHKVWSNLEPRVAGLGATVRGAVESALDQAVVALNGQPWTPTEVGDDTK